jgi:hypothetical protein
MFRWGRDKVEEHTRHNEQEILSSGTCGCLSCTATFKPEEVTAWKEEVEAAEHPERHEDRTGICPHCGDALIIGDRSGYEVNKTFLEAMRMR